MATTSNSSVGGSSASGSASSRAIDVGISVLTPTPVSTAEVSREPKRRWENAGDSCTWYANGMCSEPRTCADCINVMLQKDTCAVDPNGICVSMDAYTRYAWRPRGDRGQVGFNGYFPAANFTYCEVDDATCNACKIEWHNEYWSKNRLAPPTVCRGDNNCVCISACEMPSRAESIVLASCTMFGFDRSKLVTSAYIGSAMFAIMVVFSVMFRSWNKKRALRAFEREEQEREERRERRRQQVRERQLRTGPLLDLGGWNSLRDKLLETEREHVRRSLAGIGVAAESAAHVASRDAANECRAESEEEEGAQARDASTSPPAAASERRRDGEQHA